MCCHQKVHYLWPYTYCIAKKNCVIDIIYLRILVNFRKVNERLGYSANVVLINARRLRHIRRGSIRVHLTYSLNLPNYAGLYNSYRILASCVYSYRKFFYILCMPILSVQTFICIISDTRVYKKKDFAL